LGELDILKLAREVRVIRRHVEVAVSRETKEDGPGFTGFPGCSGLFGDGAQGVG
jgi:hypothetical protein